MSDAIRVIFRHAFDRHGNRLRGRFAAMLGDQQLCVSSNPFQAAARVLLNAGYDPALPIAGRPAGSQLRHPDLDDRRSGAMDD